MLIISRYKTYLYVFAQKDHTIKVHNIVELNNFIKRSNDNSELF